MALSEFGPNENIVNYIKYILIATKNFNLNFQIYYIKIHI